MTPNTLVLTDVYAKQGLQVFAIPVQIILDMTKIVSKTLSLEVSYQPWAKPVVICYKDGIRCYIPTMSDNNPPMILGIKYPIPRTQADALLDAFIGALPEPYDVSLKESGGNFLPQKVESTSDFVMACINGQYRFIQTNPDEIWFFPTRQGIPKIPEA
jgi:hypothetical protein